MLIQSQYIKVVLHRANNGFKSKTNIDKECGLKYLYKLQGKFMISVLFTKSSKNFSYFP